MKKIILLSDTHGYLDKAMLNHMEKADEVWHAGDIGNLALADSIARVTHLRAVHGNIDDHRVRSVFTEDLRFELEQHQIWMTHIAGYPGNYSQRVRSGLAQDPPDIFICGHSHILKIIYDKHHNLLHLNPGAAGKHGFHQVRTMIRFELSEKGPGNMHVIELGKRA
jgi:putative phosphoesterase